MQVIVARHKARPLFSPRLFSVRATRLARDTCEDCWDHDADARFFSRLINIFRHNI